MLLKKKFEHDNAALQCVLTYISSLKYCMKIGFNGFLIRIIAVHYVCSVLDFEVNL